MSCLSENTIVAFLHGRPSASARVEAHIDGCAQCRALVSDVAKSSIQPQEGPTLVDEPSGAQPPEAEAGPIDTVLAGRFRLLERLGRGAMGTVYRARDLILQIDVAIKVLHPAFSQNPAYIRQLHSEILTGRRISHPNVRRIFDLGEAQGRYFISMQYLQAQTLTRVLSQATPDRDQAVAIIEQTCAALAAAHRQGVVHRDLKPSNVMIDAGGHVTVVDFGLAIDLANDCEKPGVVAGTPSHWAPEQSRGEPATARSYIFSLGVLSCDLLCGESRGLESAALLPRIPRQQRSFVRRCLAPEPEQRFASAADAYAAWPRRNGHRAGVWVALASTLAVVSVAAAAWWTRPQTPAPDPVVASQPVSPLPALLKPQPAPDPPALDSAVVRRAPVRPRPHPAEAGLTTAVVVEPTLEATAVVPGIDVAAEVQALEQLRHRLELLPDDMPDYARALRQAEATAGDDAMAFLRQARRALVDTRIDETFIRGKLERLSRRESKDARVSTLLARIHESYFAGRYPEANAYLNGLAGVLDGH